MMDPIINTRLWTENPCVSNPSLAPRGIMVHSTAAPGAMAAGWYDRWNNNNREVGVHAFVDDTSIWQYLPWTTIAWHCAGSGNRTHIAFEMCEDVGWENEYFEKAYRNAVSLTVYLCRKFGLTEANVLCHSEGYKAGIANNHADVMHWFPKFKKTMDDFRADVRAGLHLVQPEKGEEDMQTIYKVLDDVPEWGKTTTEKLVARGLLRGDGVDENGKQLLNLEHFMLRGLVINDRAGLYGGEGQ